MGKKEINKSGNWKSICLTRHTPSLEKLLGKTVVFPKKKLDKTVEYVSSDSNTLQDDGIPILPNTCT